MHSGDKIVAVGGKASDPTLYFLELAADPDSLGEWTAVSISGKVSQTESTFMMYRSTLYAYETLIAEQGRFYALDLFKVRLFI
jgi:hypothetical protein